MPLPRDPSFVLWQYVDMFSGNGVFSCSHENCRYSNPPNAYGYARESANGQYAIWRVDGVFSDTAANAAKAELDLFSRNFPNRRDSAWCSHREGGSILPFPYVGLYLAQSSRGRVLSETPYDCPHCALVEADRIIRERNLTGVRGVFLNYAEGTPIAEDYLPRYSLEIAGETRPETSATIKDHVAAIPYACGNCGRLGHNSRGCEHVHKHFDKIGIEVEGRFNDLRGMKRKADELSATYSGDGSIHSSYETSAEPYEFKTRPGSLRVALEQLVAFFPDETDRSCGMHVHMSFPQDCLTLLQTEAFYAFFKTRWEQWGARMGLDRNSEFFKRLRGENDYCNPNHDVLYNMTTCDRYSQLNFSSWQGHKTLECRLLPMFRRSSLAVAAVQELVAIYEDFLAAPEQYGIVWDEFDEAGVNAELLNTTQTLLPAMEIELPALLSVADNHEIELTELAPPAAGMVRIALPVNQPITVEALSARLRERQAA